MLTHNCQHTNCQPATVNRQLLNPLQLIFRRKFLIDALNAAGKEKLNGKIILDIANPLDFSQGMPPSLFICNTDSLGEKIQREFPES
jgi:predicted dinucleotide-binding enzyme